MTKEIEPLNISDPGESAVNQAAGLPTPVEDRRAAREQRNINEMVHRMLIIGLVISTTLMLIGLGLDLIQNQEAPTAVLNTAEALREAAALHPSGFLTLGILVLIATPILRVIGSIIAFVYERDWRYVLVTSIVLMVVMISVVSGKG